MRASAASRRAVVFATALVCFGADKTYAAGRGAATPMALGFETAGLSPGASDACAVLAERLAKARELLSTTPTSTSRGAAPHEIVIWFRTNVPGVVIPSRQRATFPTAMSIILQYQYRHLVVTPDTISVTVSFKRVRSRVAIPIDALIGVYDQTAGIKIYLRKCGWPRGIMKVSGSMPNFLRSRV